MLGRLPARKRRRTVAGDKGYDTKQTSSPEARQHGFTPHVAQNTNRRRSAIDGRTTRHPGHRHLPADPETDRGTLRLDQDHRRGPQTQLPRQRPQPGLVPPHRRRLQHPPHHRPRPPKHLTGPGAATEGPNRRSPAPGAQPTEPSRGRCPPPQPAHTADFQHPVRSCERAR